MSSLYRALKLYENVSLGRVWVNDAKPVLASSEENKINISCYTEFQSLTSTLIYSTDQRGHP